MVMNKKEQIDDILSRGVTEIIQKKDLEKLLSGSAKLRIKFGIDPTSPNIHIGRAVVLWKLRAFQDLGHKIVLIIGDFTGTIGDTSDKDAERPMLTEAQVKTNLKNYFDQAFKILDKSKTETHYNSKWLKKLSLGEISKLADLFGLHEFSSRENISKRLKAGKRVSMRELLYPLMQGYDSVAVKADVELGGTDQRFNLLAGRTIQTMFKQRPQQILMTDLLEGTDGRKMSSSWGNVINLTDSAKDMFGKVMSIQDELIQKYFLLATKVPLPEIKEIINSNKNPRDQKLILAFELTSLYHGRKIAEEAKHNFLAQFQDKQVPSDIKEVKISAGKYPLVNLLVTLGLAVSNSEARRLIQQNGVKLNGQLPKDSEITIEKSNNLLIQVGKRKFVKIK